LCVLRLLVIQRSAMSTKVEELPAEAMSRKREHASREARKGKKSKRTKEQVFSGIFSVDKVRCALTMNADGLSWIPLSLVKSVASGQNTATTNGCHAESFQGKTILAWSDIAFVEDFSERGFALHCLCVDEKAPQMPRVYVVHKFYFVGETSGADLPPVSAEDCQGIDDPLVTQERAWFSVIRNAVHASNGDPSKRQPLLVFINPFSGTKQGEHIWRQSCQPLCDAAGLKTEIVITDHAGHAREFVHGFDSSRYSAIATVGGDGILNEVINGLMTREDWKDVIGIPVCPIPGGTGNACSYTLYNAVDPCTCVAHVIRNVTRKMDIFLCVQPQSHEFIWGVLNFSNGIIAEADFGSETIRWAGSLRPSIWAVYRIMMGSLYNWRITYLPVDVPTQDWRGVRCTRNCKYCQNALQRQKDAAASHHDDDDDEKESSEKKEKESKESSETTSTTEADGASVGGAQLVHQPAPPSGPPYTSNMSTVSSWVDGVPAMYQSLFEGYEHHEIGKTVPEGWVVKDNLALCFACYQKLPWLMPGMQATPYSHLADGCMDVAFATAEAFSRIRFITLFATLGDGGHAEHPKLNYQKVRSFTLEPLDHTGYIGVDGERMPFGPAQFHVAQGIMNFLCYM